MMTEEEMEQWVNDRVAALLEHVAQGGWDQARYVAGQIARELTAYCKQRTAEVQKTVRHETE